MIDQLHVMGCYINYSKNELSLNHIICKYDVSTQQGGNSGLVQLHFHCLL